MNVSSVVQDGRASALGNGGKGFRTLGAMREAAGAQKARCTEVEAKGAGVLFVAGADGLSVDLGGAVGADSFTPWALRQVGSIAGVPSTVVDRLSPATAARVLNETWPREGEEGGPRRFLLESGAAGGSMLRAVVSQTYRRVWDADLLGEVERWLSPSGWEAAYPERNVAGPVEDRERALWRSDRDSFAFFHSARDMDKGSGTDWDGLGGMRRGLFVGNSEVGARSLSWGTFWFRALCCNFLVWNAQDVAVRRRRHTSGVVGEVADLRSWIRNAVPQVGESDLAPFRTLQGIDFPVPKGPEAWEVRFARSVADRFGVTQGVARTAAGLQDADGNARPGSYWAVVNALTSAARGLNPADRFEVSAAAGRVMSAGLVEAGAR